MITYWHNPRCSKSRAGLALLQERGAPHEIRLYLKDSPSLEEVTALRDALGVSAIAMMRKGESVFKESGLSAACAEADLLAAMVSDPILIERPIAVKEGTAIIGRPTEALEAVL